MYRVSDTGAKMAVGLRQKTHERVAQMLAGRIQEGRYPPNAPLPPYRSLAIEFCVSPTSITRAFSYLERTDVIERLGNRGFVVKRHASPAAQANPGDTLEHVSFIFPAGIRSLPRIENISLAGYTDALEAHGLRASFHAVDFGGSESYEHLNEPDFVKLLSARTPWERQGCVIYNFPCPTMMEWLRRNGVPFVLQYHDQYRKDLLPPHHAVFINKHTGTMEAAQHLLELGHRRIAYVGAIRPHPYRVRSLEAVQTTMQAWGLELSPRNMIELRAEWPEDAVAPLRQVLARPDRPTGVLCHNDAMAIGALTAARELGLRVPEDVSVIGFGDEPETLQTDPLLATVLHPRRAIARAAVEMLVSVHPQPRAECRTQILQTRLIVRKSTGPAPAGAV